MRPLRWAAIGLAGLLVAAVLAAWLAPRFLDWDRYRDTIASVASAGLGRPVRIEGPVRLSLLPQPVLTAAQVSLADTGDGVSATVPEMRLSVALGALLGGRVEVRDLMLHGADMRLPWPPRADMLQHGPPAWLTRLHARVEASTLRVGGLAFYRHRWRTGGGSRHGSAVGLRAGGGAGAALARDRPARRPGSDGAVALDASLDGQGAALNTGAALSGQIAATAR